MPSVKQHIDKAKYNEQFFEDVKYDYPDWAITGLFYSALHYVDAYLVSKGHSAEDHKTRLWFVESTKELKPIYANYRAMYDYSINARYKMHEFNIESLNDTHKTFYSPMKNDLLRLLKPIK